jgi:hypothetical protein
LQWNAGLYKVGLTTALVSAVIITFATITYDTLP